MKKKIISVIGATGGAAIIALMLIFSAPKTHASGTAAENIEALTASSGKCTGPKGASTKTCEATNIRDCSDLSGCNTQATRQTAVIVQ